MKKTILLLSLPVLILFFAGYGTSKTPPLNQEDIQAITTRVYDENFDLVYKSILSAITNEGYLITNTDYQAGVIAAESSETKGVSFVESLIADVTRTNHNYKVSIFVYKLNEQQTKVQFTLFHYVTNNYDNGRDNTTSGGRTLVASQYRNWFSRVADEIEKNKGAN